MKKFFAKIIAAIAGLFVKLAPQLRSAVHTAVAVTENLKKLVDSPVADILTAIIPGNTDEKVKIVLRQQLPRILMIMRLIESATLLDNEADIVAAATRYIAELTKEERQPILHELAVRLAVIVADGKITWSEAVQLTEYYYKIKFKPAKLSLAA